MKKLKLVSTTVTMLSLSFLLAGCDKAGTNSGSEASSTSLIASEEASLNENKTPEVPNLEKSSVDFCDIFTVYKGNIEDADGVKQEATLKITFLPETAIGVITSVDSASNLPNVKFKPEQLIKDDSGLNLSEKGVVAKFFRVDKKVNLTIKTSKFSFSGIEFAGSDAKPAERPISCNIYSNTYTVYGGGASTDDGKTYSDVKIGVTYLKDKNVLLIKPLSHEFLATAEISASSLKYEHGNFTTPEGSADSAYFFNQGGDRISAGLVIKGKDGQPYNFLGATWLK